MDADGGQERRYSDQEVRAIFARLSELQADKDSAGAGSGTTLRQLQVASAELGLDVGLLQRVVDEMKVQPDKRRGSLLFGGPWSMSSDKIVTMPMESEAWSAAVEDIRAATGRVGEIKANGSLFEWRSEDPDYVHLSLSPAGSNTRMRITAQFGSIPMMLHFMGGFFGFMFGAMIGSSLQPAGGHSLEGTLSIIASLVIGASIGFFVGRLLSIPYRAKKYRATRELFAFVERRLSVEDSSTRSTKSLVEELDERLGKPDSLGPVQQDAQTNVTA